LRRVVNFDGLPETFGAEGEQPGAEEGTDGALAPAIFEEGFLAAAVVEEGFVPVDGGAAFGAAGVGEAVEVIVAFCAGELFERGRLRPGEFEVAGWADRVGLAAEVVATAGAVDVEVDEGPGGSVGFGLEGSAGHQVMVRQSGRRVKAR